MGDVVLFSKAPAGRSAARAKSAKVRAAEEYVGLNLYIPPHRARRRRLAKRGATHGVLSAFDFGHTTGLTEELFRGGGMHPVRCTEAEALQMWELLEESVAHIEVRLVRRRKRLAA